jgi:hypothetical protein
LAIELLQKTLDEYIPVPGTPPGVPLARWRDRCWEAFGNKSRFYDIRDSLARRGRIQIKEGYVSFT